MKTKKIVLEELKVKSFVTSMKSDVQKTVLGGEKYPSLTDALAATSAGGFECGGSGG